MRIILLITAGLIHLRLVMVRELLQDRINLLILIVIMELVKGIPIFGQGLSQYMFCSLKSLGHIAPYYY